MKLLITGGTVFVSKYAATYFQKKGYDVYVLNRGNKKQVEGVTLIKGDRHQLKDSLKGYHFDAVLDVCAYTKQDIKELLDALGDFQDYIFISSSAVYPETNTQPFDEEQPIGKNYYWKNYGINKVEAEQYLTQKVPNAYIIRPAYIYGPMQNLYREPFVFECALRNRKFYIPKDGTMKLQFIHIDDLCKMMENILLTHPKQKIYNAGNEEPIDINTFVDLCYQVVGTPLEAIHVYDHDNPRDYFSFSDYEYVVNTEHQKEILKETIDFKTGLKESFDWYFKHQKDVLRREYIDFIDQSFK